MAILLIEMVAAMGILTVLTFQSVRPAYQRITGER